MHVFRPGLSQYQVGKCADSLLTKLPLSWMHNNHHGWQLQHMHAVLCQRLCACDCTMDPAQQLIIIMQSINAPLNETSRDGMQPVLVTRVKIADAISRWLNNGQCSQCGKSTHGSSSVVDCWPDKSNTNHGHVCTGALYSVGINMAADSFILVN